jgi:hypothetical protein
LLLIPAILLAPEGEPPNVPAPDPLPSSGLQQQELRIDPQYSCVVCHTEKRRAFLLGVHSERGIQCHDCHGGNPRAFETASAHAGPDYIGAPDKLTTIELCASCHSDPDRMRQYGLHVGQLAEFRTSRHGLLLLEKRNRDAPTCTDCHDAHTILPPNDARSNVYPTNIVRTCARCHEDPDLMGKYGLPTDQVSEYRKSEHGVGVFVKHNFAAPTCVSCHGSHAALPPAVTQISDVCGQCHVLVRRAFYDGPHGKAALAGKLPGCTACHSNHGTERVHPERIADTCTRCHESNSPAALIGIEIQESVTRATEELEAAEEAINELVRAGRPVSDIRLRYEAALTAYMQMAQAQHSLDRQVLEELSREAISIARDIRGVAEVTAEQQWEHKLILIPVWFLALAATILASFKLLGLASRKKL